MQQPWERCTALVAVIACLALFAWAASGAAGAEGDKKLKEGDPAPDIDLPATQIEKSLPDAKGAKTLHLKDLQGKKNVVLYFFPKALTGGWTTEACGFRDRAEQFAQLDTVIIGISTDKLEDQQKFTDKEKLPFSLYADSDKKAAEAYGVLGSSGYAQRVTFVIDKKGIIRKIYTKVDPSKGPEETLQYVKDTLSGK